MIDSNSTVNEIRGILAPLFDTYHIKKAILFGSYSKQTASKNSDLDLLVDSGLKGLSFVDFIEDIRRHVGIEVDVFDITHVEKNSKLEREIQESGITIYEE